MKHVPDGTKLPEALLNAASELDLVSSPYTFAFRSRLPFAIHADEDRLSMMQVENTALMTNNSRNDYIGVNLYTDDNAGMYNAPSNHRASEFAFCCGKQLEVGSGSFCWLTLAPEPDLPMGCLPADCDHLSDCRSKVMPFWQGFSTMMMHFGGWISHWLTCPVLPPGSR